MAFDHKKNHYDKDGKYERNNGKRPIPKPTQEKLTEVFKSEEITQEPRHIAHLIRSSQETPRENKMSKARLVELRKKVEKQIKNDYLRRMNAPAGVKPELRSWMEIN